MEKKSYPKVSSLIKLFCFKEYLINKCKEKIPNVEKDITFVKKAILDIYLNHLKYDELSSYLTKNNEILNCIKEGDKLKYDKLNDDNINNIIQKINKDKKNNLILKIESINLDKIIKDINQEDRKHWNYKKYKYEKGHASIKLQLVDNFEILNSDLYNLLTKQQIKIKSTFLGNCAFFGGKIFAFLLNVKSMFFEIGKFENRNIKIDYITDNNEIEDLINNVDFITKNSEEFLKKIKKNKEIFNINIGIKNISFYNVEKLKTEDESIQNYCDKFDKKIKDLVLLAIFQNIYFQNKNKEEEVFLLDKNYFDQFSFSQINSMISDNKNLQNIILNIKPENISINLINEVIYKMDKDNLKKISKTFSGIKNNKLSYKPKKEEIILFKSKKINLFKNFILINQNVFNDYFSSDFNIHLDNQNISFININNKDILKISNNKQFTLFIGYFNYIDYSYKIEKILDFESSDDLNSELKFLETIQIDSYYNDRLIDNIKDGDISPIFSSNKIIGYSYNYNQNIKDYSQKNEYIKFLFDNILIGNLLLYSFYIQIEKKLKESNKISPELYYIIDQQLLTDIKIESRYKKLKDDLEKEKINLDDLYNDEINIKNIYSFLKACPPYIFRTNSNIKMNTQYINYNKEIDYMELNYFDYKENKKNSIAAYHKFGIIGKPILELYLGKEKVKNNNKLLECFFNNDYIIINLPYNLNNKFVSLLGTLDFDDNNFKLEYFMVYYDEKYRKGHIQNIISNKIDNYINNLHLTNKNSPISNNNKILGTITKYGEVENKNININEIGNVINNNKIIFENNFNNSNNSLNNNYNINYNNFNYINNLNNFIFINNFNNNYNNINNYNSINFNNNLNNFNFNYNSNNNMNINQIINQNPNKRIIDLKYSFNLSPKIGLQNIGATCYMNATLQCFCHIKKFVEYFKYKFIPAKTSNNEDKLSPSFKILIDNLWPDNYNDNYNQMQIKYFAPNEFKEKISRMNPLFNGIAANDAKDLVNFIIMTIHSELNKKNESNQNDDYSQIDQSNRELVFKCFIKEFTNNNKSIISELFYSNNCSVSECSLCHKKIYNYQIYFFIIFPLEEVRKYKNINNNIVSIYDCFDYDRKQNVMSGENSMYCNYCRKSCDFTMTTNLVTCPQILIIILNRGKGKEYDIKINFDQSLNLNNYIEYVNTGYNYELIGVITHIGESSMSGHFIAYCKDPISNNWHKYNDAIVTEVNNFQEEVINFAMPYLLFYQKVN